MLSDVKLNAQTVRVWGCMKQNRFMSAFSMVGLKAYQPILTMYIHLALIWISQICGQMIATMTEATTTPANGPAIMQRKLCEYRNEAAWSRHSMTDIATTQMHLHKTSQNNVQCTEQGQDTVIRNWHRASNSAAVGAWMISRFNCTWDANRSTNPQEATPGILSLQFFHLFHCSRWSLYPYIFPQRLWKKHLQDQQIWNVTIIWNAQPIQIHKMGQVAAWKFPNGLEGLPAYHLEAAKEHRATTSPERKFRGEGHGFWVR